jgi:hypothetical protein
VQVTCKEVEAWILETISDESINAADVVRGCPLKTSNSTANRALRKLAEVGQITVTDRGHYIRATTSTISPGEIVEVVIFNHYKGKSLWFTHFTLKDRAASCCWADGGFPPDLVKGSTLTFEFGTQVTGTFSRNWYGATEIKTKRRVRVSYDPNEGFPPFQSPTKTKDREASPLF